MQKFQIGDPECARYRRLLSRLSATLLTTIPGPTAGGAVILEADEDFYNLTGYTAEEIGGRYLDLVDQRDRIGVEEALRRQWEAPGDYDFSYRLTVRSGATLWIRETGYVEQSDPPTRQSALIDMTELHRRIEDAAQSEQLFRIASGVSGGAVYDYEFSTGTYLMFENAERIYGVPAQRILEETRWFGTLSAEKALIAMADYFYHPDDTQVVLTAFERLQKERAVQYVARSKRPDGTFLWTQVHIALIYDRNGTPVRRVGHILDIDGLKRHADEMAQSEQLFRITNNASGGAVFDFDLRTGTYLHFENAERIYGVPAQRIISDTRWFGTLTREKAQDAMISYFYHPEDAHIVREAFQRLSTEGGITYMARSKRYDGSFIWSQIHIALISDENGVPVRRVGHILDIDDMARQMELLKSQAQSDPLTGIYNKLAAQSIVDTVLRKKDDELCALMVLDIDNFKGVNDTFGHAVGDAVLVDACQKLQAAFGDQTLGRIGGDEFIVFAMGMERREQVLEQAELVCRLFRETYIGPNADYKISCSIGVAISQGESHFEDLFKKADIALYEAKSAGKDRYCLYEAPRC